MLILAVLLLYWQQNLTFKEVGRGLWNGPVSGIIYIYIYYIGFPGSTQSDTHKSKIGPLLSHGTYLVLRVQCVTKIDLYICAILQIICISKYRQVLLVACIRGGLDQHIHWANARIKQGVLFCNATNMFYISLIYNYPGNETVSGMNISLIYKF